MPRPAHPPESIAPSAASSCEPVRRPRRRRWVLLFIVAVGFFALGWLSAPAFSPSRTSAFGRERALRLADEAVRHAHAENWRDAYLSAARARSVDPFLPGMELVLGQMLFNVGDAQAAAAFARMAQKRDESSSAIAVLLGLEAWTRRGADPASVARAGLLSRLWMENEAASNLSDGALRFFLAEIDRLAGKPEPRDMLQALHRFHPWESSVILDAKMHLAASEAGPQFNAAHLGRGLRLNVSPQARAVKNLRRAALEDADQSAAQRELVSLFAERHLILLGIDSAFFHGADTGRQRASISSASRESLPE